SLARRAAIAVDTRGGTATGWRGSRHRPGSRPALTWSHAAGVPAFGWPGGGTRCRARCRGARARSWWGHGAWTGVAGRGALYGTSWPRSGGGGARVGRCAATAHTARAALGRRRGCACAVTRARNDARGLGVAVGCVAGRGAPDDRSAGAGRFTVWLPRDRTAGARRVARLRCPWDGASWPRRSGRARCAFDGGVGARSSARRAARYGHARCRGATARHGTSWVGRDRRDGAGRDAGSGDCRDAAAVHQRAGAPAAPEVAFADEAPAAP